MRAVKNAGPPIPNFPGVVAGQASQAAASEPVAARVSGMQHMRSAATQNERCERASHPFEFRVLPAQGMDPAVECIQDPRCRALNFQGLRQVAKSIQKTAHCRFGRGAAALSPANVIGDCRLPSWCR